MDNKLSELSKPVRIHRDWNRASMCHCGKCDRWEMTIADADGVQTCASCYDAEWLSEWQDYAEAADKRIAELEANLATPVLLSCETHPRCRTQHAKDVRAAGFTVQGDEYFELLAVQDINQLKRQLAELSSHKCQCGESMPGPAGGCYRNGEAACGQTQIWRDLMLKTL